MSKTLLDTDTFSEVLRAVNATVIGNARVYRQAYGRLTLSVITVMEMVKGLQKVQQPRKIVSLLTHIGTGEVLEFGQHAAEIAGRILGDLERTGQPIGLAAPEPRTRPWFRRDHPPDPPFARGGKARNGIGMYTKLVQGQLLISPERCWQTTRGSSHAQEQTNELAVGLVCRSKWVSR